MIQPVIFETSQHLLYVLNEMLKVAKLILLYIKHWT